MNFRDIPRYLLNLYLIIEILIVQTQVYIDFQRMKKYQLKYFNHIVKLTQNTDQTIH